MSAEQIFYKVDADPLEYKEGSIVTARQLPDGKQELILAFPNLDTAKTFGGLGYWGFAEYTGFIAEGRPIGQYKEQPLSGDLSDLCVRLEGLQVTAIRRFIKGEEIG